MWFKIEFGKDRKIQDIAGHDYDRSEALRIAIELLRHEGPALNVAEVIVAAEELILFMRE